MIPGSRFIKYCLYAIFGVCPLLFFTNLTRNPYYTQIVLLNILVCCCWLSWIFQAWKVKEWVWVRSPMDGVLWVLMAVSFISWVVSFYLHPNFKLPLYSEGSRAYIFLIVNTYLSFAAAVRFQDRERLKRLIWITYAVAVAASFYGIAQYYGTEWIWNQALNPYGSRPVSTFGNPNFMSSFLVTLLPVAIMDYVFKITGISRIWLFWVISASVGALIATLTRSSWGGALVGLTVAGVGMAFSLRREDWIKVRTPVIVIAILLAVLTASWPKSSSAAYSETVFGRISEVKQITQGAYGAVTQRFLIWLCAWSMVEDHPFLGKGWGAFELFYPYYQGAQLDKPDFFTVRTHANNAHNEVLEYWAQLGTLGFGIVILMWIAFFRSGKSVASRLPLPWRALSWGLMGGVAGMLADNLLNVSVHFAVPAFLFWWWVGSLFVLDPASVQVRKFSLEPLWRRGILAAAAALLICLSLRSAMLWAEEIYFFEGFKFSKGGDLARAQRSLERAYSFHQLDVNNAYELANVYARTAQKEKALAMYQRALDANSGYDEIYFNRATMLMQSGREVEAIHNYKVALAINPLSREAYNALSGIYFKDVPKYGDEAVGLLRRATAIFSTDRDLWNNLGYLEVQRQNWPAAQEAYRKALDIDPQYDLARRNLAVVEQNLRKAAP